MNPGNRLQRFCLTMYASTCFRRLQFFGSQSIIVSVMDELM